MLRWDCGNTVLQNRPPGNPGPPQLVRGLPRLPLLPLIAAFRKDVNRGPEKGVSMLAATNNLESWSLIPKTGGESPLSEIFSAWVGNAE